MEKEEIKKHLKQAFWDVDCQADELYAVLTKEKAQAHYITLERIYVRLLESYSWYTLLALVPHSQLHELLAEQVIGKLRAKALQNRYRHVARILRSTTLPTSR